MTEIELLQKQIDDLKFILNQIILPGKYRFQKDVSIMAGKSFGTDTGSKIGFYGATPIIQPTSTGETGGVTGGAGTTITSTGTFTGGSPYTTAYTLSDVVKHLKELGILLS